MIFTYRVLTGLLYPFLVVLIYFRKILNKEHSERYKEKILSSHFNVIRKKNSKLIWFHAASIGEFKSIIPIIKKLNDENNNFEFLITTITLSSSNLAIEELKNFNNVYHRFMPIDVEYLTKKFLYLWKPSVIFLVDSEIWPNLIFIANKNKIPLALINARITAKTFKRWMMVPQIAKKIFNLFDLCLTSNLQTKDYLKKLDAKNINFEGNIKLINSSNNNISNPNEKFLLKNKFWFAASTHKGEDIFCIETHLALKKHFKNMITIIAPRHIDRVKKIKILCEKYNLKVQILNKADLILNDKEIILINSFGLLESFFKYTKSVFIGKSLLKKLEHVGGQNPIDAAKSGCKIYHGPYVYNFNEIYEILQKNGITKQIFNYSELSYNLIKDFEEPKKKNNEILETINKLGQKTLAETMSRINTFLRNEI
tara:strand:+ start:924 stop:2201 length:1278 start_codon:yes stop_codon:yes gene_type:complete